MDKIYTRTGDLGTTSLHRGTRVPKTDLRIKANGCIDHLNSTLGIIVAIAQMENRYFPPEHKSILQTVQHDLMKMMAMIAAIPSNEANGLPQEYVDRLEANIDAILAETNIPIGFIIPGGSFLSSFMHLARTDARSAEIALWELNDVHAVDSTLLAYFNRLSDLLFVMSISI